MYHAEFNKLLFFNRGETLAAATGYRIATRHVLYRVSSSWLQWGVGQLLRHWHGEKVFSSRVQSGHSLLHVES